MVAAGAEAVAHRRLDGGVGATTSAAARAAPVDTAGRPEKQAIYRFEKRFREPTRVRAIGFTCW